MPTQAHLYTSIRDHGTAALYVRGFDSDTQLIG